MQKHDNDRVGGDDGLRPLVPHPSDGGVLATGLLARDVFEGAAPAARAGHALRFGTLLRRKWTFLVVFLVLAVPGAALAWLRFVPLYEAGAVVEVSPVIRRLVFKTDDNGVIPLYRQYLNTQVAIIRSPQVLERVLDRPEVQQTAWYREGGSAGGGPALRPIERLLLDLSVRPRKDTHVIDVKLTARNPRDAAILVNGVVDEYRKYVQQTSRQTDDELYQKLREEYNTLRATIEGLEGTINRFREQLGTGDPDQLLSHRRTQLEEMEAQLEALRRDIALTKFELERLATAGVDVSAAAVPAASQPARLYESDPDWRRLQMEYQTLQARLDREQGRLGDSHPNLIALRQNADLARIFLAQREAQLDLLWDSGLALSSVPVAPNSPGVLRERLERLEYQENLLVQDIRTRQEEVKRTAEVAQRLAGENDALRHKRELYDAVRERIAQRDLERGAPGAIRVQSSAYPPTLPANTRQRWLLTGLALLGSAGLALLAAYLRTARDRSVQAYEDLPAAGEAPFLGHVPLVRDPSRMGPDEEATRAEHVRMIRTALLERLNGRRGSAVLVTSAGPAAGKTTLAMLLAKSLAQCGKRTLLVDCDLRNASLATRFDLPDAPGLIGILTAAAADAEAIRSNGVPGLDILPAGSLSAPLNPELLANGAFAASLGRWREHYDIVLLDTPPVLPVADTRILASQVDGAMLVVREGRCRRTEVMDALAFLSAAGGRLLGSVFLRVPRRHSPGYYSSHYYQHTGAAAGLDAREVSSPPA